MANRLMLGFNQQIMFRRPEYEARTFAMPLGGMTAIGDQSTLEYSLKFACPVVYRFDALDGPGQLYNARYGQGDPVAFGVEFVNEIRRLIGPNYRGFYYQMGWDEKKGNLEWNALATIAALREADKDGLKLCCINLFWGNPPQPDWDGFDGWDTLWPAVEQIALRRDRAIIGLHAYIDPAFPVTLNGQAHALTRPIYLVEKMRRAGIYARVGLTETGLTVMWRYAHYSSLAAYGLDLRKIPVLYAGHPEVEFANVYTLDKLDAGGEYPADRDVFTQVEIENKSAVVVSPAPIPAPSPTPAPAGYMRATAKTAVNVRLTPQIAAGNIVTTIAPLGKGVLDVQPGGWSVLWLNGYDVGWTSTAYWNLLGPYTG